MVKGSMDKIVAGILIAVIVIAIGVFAYYSLSKNEKESAILIVSYENEKYSYSISDLKNLDDFSGSGGYITSHGFIRGPENYTGVRITELLGKIDATGDYKLEVIAKDNYSVNYTIDEIEGNVTVYDISRNETVTGGVTMILAYVENGNYNFDDGPLRIAYVNDQGAITSSKLWAKWVVELKIIDDE